MKSVIANKENLIIIIAWLFIYAMAPLYIWYADTLNGFEFNIHILYGIWMTTTTFLLLYILHHFYLAPKFLVAKRHLAYAATLCLCLVLFAVVQTHLRPKPFMRKEEMHIRHEMRRHGGDDKPFGKPYKPRRGLPPHDVASIIMLLLMFGVDIGTIAWMNSQKLQRRLLIMERQNLEQELTHLKHQINPHFFMNTLNNIHVLIDIDQEKAKRSLVELSKLMRYTLYEGTGSLVLLSQEIDFISRYISLMKLRYSDKVEIVSRMPDVTNGIQIPPLLLVTFIENAFKHGISYQQPSFIIVTLAVDDDNKTIHFECSNSRHTLKQSDVGGGIGLENVRKRLDLIYEKNYSLTVTDDDPEQYRVILDLKSL